MRNTRSIRRGLGAALALLMVAGTLAACQPAVVGGRCRGNGFGRDSTWVLQCKGGRWRKIITIRDYLLLLERLNAGTPTPAAPAPPATSAAPSTAAPPTQPDMPVQPPTVPSLVEAPNTVSYESGEVAGLPPVAGSGVLVQLSAESTAPVVGGHVAIGPGVGLPDGMFGQVLAVNSVAGGVIAELGPASIDSVYTSIDVRAESSAPPEIIDADGNPHRPSISSGGGVGALAVPTSAWECKKSGVSTSLDKLWESSGDPVQLRFENTRVLHRFSAGGLFAAPFLLLQFSGEVVASIGYTAKAAGFSCELSPSFRRNHRLRFSVGSIGPVPVSVNVEPVLSFEVDLSGRLALAQRHYFALTLQQDGFSAPDFRLARSADAPHIDASAALTASFFVGGDLSVMAGGGYKSANAQAGIYGAFGPTIEASISTANRLCLDVSAGMRADLGVRLELWSKRWSPTLAKLTVGNRRVLGPWCPLGSSDPTEPTDPTDPTDPGMPSGPGGARSVAVGERHACATMADGTVKCWGDNSSGQLGDGTTTDRRAPVTVTGIAGATAVTAGGSHSCAVVARGEVRCWGSNSSGTLGDGTSEPRVGPVAVSGLSGVRSIDAGLSHTCAVVDGGRVKCWGYQGYGALGVGGSSSVGPVEVVGITGATAIASGYSHSCVVAAEGRVKCWGSNRYGELGNGTTVTSKTPVEALGVSGATAISSTELHTCAVLADGGSATCWALFGEDATGWTVTGFSTTPHLTGVRGVTSLAVGTAHACAVVAGGGVQCWGWGWDGQLGNGTMIISARPVAVVGLTNATSVSVGRTHSCAVTSAGHVMCWGSNSDGQLGIGQASTSPSSVPLYVAGL